MGKLLPWRNASCGQQYSNSPWHSKNIQLVLSGPIYVKKSFLTQLQHHYHPELLIQVRLGQWIPTIVINFRPYHLHVADHIFPILSCSVWWACSHYTLRFLFLASRFDMCALTCFLFTKIVKNSYLTTVAFLAPQTCHSLLTFLFNKACLWTESMLTGNISFSTPFCVSACV